jgi:peptidyl-prolyl cis-trans isomerase B (cyclophilin B)
VGTDKRERQKANRQLRLEELQKQQAQQKRRRVAVIWGGVIALALVVAFGIWFFNHGKNDNVSASDTTLAPAASTTAPPPGATAAATPGTTAAPPPGATAAPTPCPAADGSSPTTGTFAAPMANCIDPTKTYTATVETNKGTFTVTLDPAKAPNTVNNFVGLSRYHYYDNTPCHRIITDFVVQCGDPTGQGTGGPGYEFADELPQAGEYKIGSLAMANSGPNTNGSQFFIITGDQGTQLPPNYALFGQVTDGFDTTVKAMAAAANPDPTKNGVPPTEPITITKVTINES